MLNSLTIILQEVLEAAIIISILLASLQKTRLKGSLLIWGLLAGVAGSLLMASQYAVISDALDGVGQEVLNAVMLFILALMLTIYIFLLVRYSRLVTNFDPLIKLVLSVIIFIAVLREGVEIIIYVSGYLANLSDNSSLLVGGSIGAWIGISSGILIYYSLLYCTPQIRLNIIIFIAAILIAGMVSEGLLYLMQADWIESGKPLWDSSFIIAESSITGQLLYATFSYEATPSGLQVAVYLLTLISILLVVINTKQLNKNSISNEKTLL